jgi:hypothetical protein
MHGRRVAYYIIGEGVFSEDFATLVGQDGGAPPPPPLVPSLKFGRLFGRTERAPRPEERDRVIQKLIQLGLRMNEPAKNVNQPASNGNGAASNEESESDIPAGYTYLGQFIAHEITHDSTGDILSAGLRPDNLSTPEIDLDSLYGGENGPRERPELYRADGIRLRLNETQFSGNFNYSFRNDLPRGTKDSPVQALTGDPRNDENLALAQTHVAFIHFHNKVVEALAAAGCPANKLFQSAREQVIRHYQWIILHDFLPRLVRADVLDCVMRHGLRWFKGNDLFMPLEFSAAAFRIGHSMVRGFYEWNPLRRTGSNREPAPPLIDLFNQTGFLRNGPSSTASGKPSAADGSGLATPNAFRGLTTDWIIDWRHFYEFDPLPHVRPVQKVNMSGKLDTVFDMRLDSVKGFPDADIDKMQKAITVRNLLRGFYLGLPTGEEAAEWMGETPLTRKQIASGPHESLLDDPAFWGKTPLWYYILKEAEVSGFGGPDGKQPGNRLGPVGGRIVAETLVGLIKQSRYSILEDKNWRPCYGCRNPDNEGKCETFEMIDLLNFAGVVDPVATYIRANLTSFPNFDLQEGPLAAGSASTGGAPGGAVAANNS